MPPNHFTVLAEEHPLFIVVLLFFEAAEVYQGIISIEFIT